MPTTADLFIIETLDPDDEGNGRFEGQSIAHVLRLHDKRPEYRYVRTRKQFKKAVREFHKSGYRYLHISTHGNSGGMITTNRDSIRHSDLISMLGTRFRGRRLFLSACSMVHRELAAPLIKTTGCRSVVGPRDRIRFTDAAVFWPALYHLMFRDDSERMTRKKLAANLGKMAKLFEVEIGSFSRKKASKNGFIRDILPR